MIRLFNKTAIKWALILAVALNMAGCASPYMTDRGRDAADIFSATLGLGAGARARVGPVHAGLLAGVDLYGLRGGQVYDVTENDFFNTLVFEGTVLYVELFCESNVGDFERFKDYGAGGTFLAGWVRERHASTSISPYYTEIVLQGGLLFSARLSFNPGELLDFILGWFTIDFYGDDIGLVPTREDYIRMDEKAWEVRKGQFYDKERARLSGAPPSATNSVKVTEDTQVKASK